MRLFGRKGFTLLELLVVISIIGILIAMGAVAYSTAQKKGRDARRTGDMKAIQNAMEQAYASSGSYPSFSGCPSTVTMGTGSTFQMPSDPKNSSPYVYTCSVPAGLSYCACAPLEGTTTGGNSSTTSCGYSSGSYFCVSNLQ